MASTGTKVAIGVAVAGVASIVVAALASRSAAAAGPAPAPGTGAAKPPASRPPTGTKTAPLDPKYGITLKAGDMGTMTVTGKDSPITGTYEASANLNVHVPNALSDSIQSYESTNTAVVDPMVLEPGSQALSDAILRRGETTLTFRWTQGKAPRVTTVKLVAK